MTVLSGEQLQAVASAGLKVVSIVNPAPVESRITPVVLPTADPGSDQWSYTVLSSDLAVPPPGFVYARQVGTACISGQNTGGSSQTVQVRAYLNGVQFTSSPITVPAGNYWSAQAYFAPLSAGAVLGWRAWCSTGSTLITYDTIVYQMLGSRLAPLGGGWAVYAPLTIGAPASAGDLALSGAFNTGTAAWEEIANGEDNARTSATVARSYTAFAAGPANGLYRLWEGDQLTTIKTSQGATNHPQWSRPFPPASITYRKLNLRVPV